MKLNLKPSPHDRSLKARRCRGCGEIKGTEALKVHEYQCLVSQVRPGDQFETLLRTSVGGRDGNRNFRRPVPVEIVAPLPQGGWKVKSLYSGRETYIETPRRFLNWKSYAPGLRWYKREHKGEN